MKNKLLILVGAFVILFVSCKKKNEETPEKAEYNRKELLANFGDNIILPRYNSLSIAVTDLNLAYQTFNSLQDSANLVELRNNFIEVYTKWQGCSAFEFGPAENNGLKTFVNTFPTDSTKINNNIINGGYNLNTASNIDATGLPALDYLLFKNESISATLTFFNNSSQSLVYVGDIITQLSTLTNQVLADWQNSYLGTFKNADGTDAGSSMSKVINTLNFDFESFIRDGKVGIPLGVRSLGTPLPEKTESYYGKQSLVLLTESINKLQDYFNGNGEITGTNGIDDYLNHLEAMHGSDLLSTKINNQFAAIKSKINQFSGPISQEVITNQAQVQELYDELQKMIVLLKVDVSSALSILITYQDNDGD